MARQTINIGSAPNDGTGDTLRAAFTKQNANNTELYTTVANLQAAIPAPPPVANAVRTLPSSGIMARYKSSDITGLTDGQSISSWIDTVGGYNATSDVGKEPKYIANTNGGKPAVRCAGSLMRIGRPTALINTMKADHSVLIFYANPKNREGDFSILLGDEFGGCFYGATRSEVQVNNIRSRSPLDSNVRMIGFSAETATGGRLYNNGTMFKPISSQKPKGNVDLCIGNDAAGSYGTGGCDILEIVIFNRNLTAAEMYQAWLYASLEYGGRDPLAGLYRFDIYAGDSQTAGTGDDVDYAYPNFSARMRGHQMGSFANVGLPSGGVASGYLGGVNNLTDRRAGDVVAFKDIVGLPIRLIWFEYYNRGNNTASADTGYSDALIAQNVAYNALIRDEVPGVQIVMGTSMNSFLRSGPSRANYNTKVMNHPTKCGADYLVPIHLNPDIGLDTAAVANNAPTRRFSDGIHNNRLGAEDLAVEFNKVIPV